MGGGSKVHPRSEEEHKQTVELGNMLAPVGIQVNCDGDVVEVSDGPQVGGNQRADVSWEDGLQFGEEGLVRDAADAGARELACS